jgi:hypothetical protein
VIEVCHGEWIDPRQLIGHRRQLPGRQIHRRHQQDVMLHSVDEQSMRLADLADRGLLSGDARYEF